MQKNDGFLRRFHLLELRFQELDSFMSDSAVAADHRRYQALARERAVLEEHIRHFREYQRNDAELDHLAQMLAAEQSADFLALVAEEQQRLRQRQSELATALEDALIEPDPDADKNIILEIRAGTGGEEAALFAADLFRMYRQFAQRKGFAVECLAANPTELGGFKELICSVEGTQVYRYFKYESGVHRVQRVPSTEAAGRIHTSAATVAVLPEVEDSATVVRPQDLKIDVYRSGGAGGQHVNTTDSAVRITHLPTGIVVTCQDERSQIKNRDKALKVLSARLYECERRQQEQKTAQSRRTQVGSGDRSEKIRTYNFPDRRVTDHRIGLTSYRIEQIMAGDLDEIVRGLWHAERALKLEAALATGGGA